MGVWGEKISAGTVSCVSVCGVKMSYGVTSCDVNGVLLSMNAVSRQQSSCMSECVWTSPLKSFQLLVMLLSPV